MKKRIIILCGAVVLLGWLTGGCSSPRDRLDSMALVTEWPTIAEWRVAVLDFETPQAKEWVKQGVTMTVIVDAGVKLSDAFASMLGEEPGYMVVDRALALRTLREHSLPTVGIPPAEQLVEIGKVLKVDGLVLGRCEALHWGNRYEWGEELKASLWLIMAESGRSAWSLEGNTVMIGSDQDVTELLARDMVDKLMAGSRPAQLPSGLSPGPYPPPVKSSQTPVPPISVVASSPHPYPEKDIVGMEMESLPEEFGTTEAIKEALSGSGFKGSPDPSSTRLNQYGYDIFVIWIDPFSGRKATNSFAYFHNPQTDKWNLFDESSQEGEDSLRNVYIDPGTDRLVYMGENGRIVREIPLEHLKDDKDR
jgi:hypothetical protein